MIETIIIILFFAFVVMFLIRVSKKIEKLEMENAFYRNALENIANNDTDCSLDFSYFAEHEAKEVLWRVDNYGKR